MSLVPSAATTGEEFQKRLKELFFKTRPSAALVGYSNHLTKIMPAVRGKFKRIDVLNNFVGLWCLGGESESPEVGCYDVDRIEIGAS